MNVIKTIFALLLLSLLTACGASRYNDVIDATNIAALLADAKAGNPNAQFDLGVLYVTGQGVPQNDKQALAWFRKAAVQGLDIAQYNLGLAYSIGLGVPQDDKQASEWYRKAADQGLVVAQNKLALMYRYGGQGIPQDDKRASEWYGKAADQGDAFAQSSLGAMYLNGQGVPRETTGRR